MNPGIFLIQNDEEPVEMNEQAYDSEKLLHALPGGKPDRRQRAMTKIESEIEHLVYKLYELTDDEIAIVEGKA